MNRFVIDTLREQDLVPVFAYHLPYSLEPSLSVPSFNLLTRKVGFKRSPSFHSAETHVLGAWLPELEFTHYWPTKDWKNIINGCDYHIAVCGNALAATPLALTKTRHMAWIATPWFADRQHRIQGFSMVRKLIDRTIVRPITERLEKKLLSEGTVVALSRYTKMQFDQLMSDPVPFVLPMPIDQNKFYPHVKTGNKEKKSTPTVGFVGRFVDPRKNISLLIDALGLCKQRGQSVQGLFVGSDPTPEIRARIAEWGLCQQITTIDTLAHDELPHLFRKLDLFVIPSHQEGLCIAGLEAMACGVPVVSTHCGGPEDFVKHGKNGYFVDSTPESMADSILSIITNPERQTTFGEQALKTITRDHSVDGAKQVFWTCFDNTFSTNFCRPH